QPAVNDLDSARVVELGRHVRLRGVWVTPCEFKSRPGHHLICSVAGPLLRKGTRIVSDAVFAAWAVGGGLGDDPDQLDAEAILGAHFVLGAAMRAPYVRAARVGL